MTKHWSQCWIVGGEAQQHTREISRHSELIWCSSDQETLQHFLSLKHFVLFSYLTARDQLSMSMK